MTTPDRAPLRVVLAEDAVFLRQAIAEILRAEGVDVVAEVGDVPALHAAVDRHTPDVVVVDVRLPPTFQTEGLRAAAELRRTHPGTGVLVLSAHVETRYLFALLDGAPRGVGYLLKDTVSGVDAFVDALYRVRSGGYVVDRAVVDAMLAAPRQPAEVLSPAQHAVLALMAQGLSNQAIGAQLFLTLRTVEAHIRGIFVRLDLPPAPDYHRRVLAVLAYLRPESL
ncbi:response regulator transcription factor [Sinosporangium siamense]|uniref:DNA-binding response regulator n=1 Tax=Sinosporangium siamense TaxID=1367973 RepID=A0A919VFF2_9ACTN|nr:response regulator transcription factor [Sinosporangium siamense]GII96064.1 DNA-binding response regulator [Sinosporangium siamense]